MPVSSIFCQDVRHQLTSMIGSPEVLHTGLGENDLLGSMIAKHLGPERKSHRVLVIRHGDACFVFPALVLTWQDNNTMSHDVNI